MRKIEKAMCEAVKEHRNWESGNTRVETGFGGRIDVYLWGNRIYTQQGEKRMFSLCGWNTNTTRSRLNALGCGVCQKNFAPYYNGNKIDEYKWYDVK